MTITKKTKLAVGLFMIIIVVISFGAFRCFAVAKRCATYSQVASIHAFLQREDFEEKHGWERTIINEWRPLAEAEYVKLADMMAKTGTIDRKGSNRDPKQIMLDPWHRHIQIAIRRREGSNLEFRVWSAGHDGLSDTADDIISE